MSINAGNFFPLWGVKGAKISIFRDFYGNDSVWYGNLKVNLHFRNGQFSEQKNPPTKKLGGPWTNKIWYK